MSDTDPKQLFAGKHAEQHEDDELANDAVQLVVIATFNGLCRLMAAVSRNGLVTPDQLTNIHDAMTTPLDDPDWRDDSFVTRTRETVEIVLAQAMSEAKVCWDEPD